MSLNLIKTQFNFAADFLQKNLINPRIILQMRSSTTEVFDAVLPDLLNLVVPHVLNPIKHYCSFLKHYVKLLDLSHIPTNNGAESRSGWTKIQQLYENVHPNLALELLFERAEVESRKGLMTKTEQVRTFEA